MRTSKPFSTISYNTDAFLVVKLNDLVRRGVLDFWVYVEHLPEDDEKKKHKHVYLVPSKLVDTTQIDEFMKEIDVTNADGLPLGCIMFKSSNFSDWFMYAQHDIDYLMSKGQSRRFGYALNEFKTSSEDYFTELRHEIDFRRTKPMQRLIEAAESGYTFADVVMMGIVPPNLVIPYQRAFELVSSRITNRNGRSGHEIDPVTGEVLD